MNVHKFEIEEKIKKGDELGADEKQFILDQINVGVNFMTQPEIIRKMIAGLEAADDREPLATKADMATIKIELNTGLATVKHKMATRDDLATVKAELKGDLADVKQQMATRDDLADVKSELKGDLADVKGDLADVKDDLADVKSELKTGLATVRTDLVWIKGIGGAIMVAQFLPWLSRMAGL